ncbi:uncharacterized protein LOC135929348 [Gordionus sp. m RMFG-2023]|uniref:uncharacterized protein LOC135929348 n=1 Tax=Gordionus sp. m RMFG-2023 TaxID=3053472 RepID=UPI0031FD76FF
MRMWEEQETATKSIMVVFEFAQAFDLALTNTYYREKDSHLITYESGTRKQIDYMLISRRRLKDVMDCKDIPGEDIAAQHKLLVMDLHITNKSTQNKIKLEPCIKWGKLKTMTNAFAINANIETIDSLQVNEKRRTNLSPRLIETAKSTLGLTRGAFWGNRQQEGNMMALIKLIADSEPILKMCFSVVVDGTYDVSKSEAIALIVRYVENSETPKPVERLIDIYCTGNTTGLDIKHNIISKLGSMNLPLEYLVWQSYDDALNMSGRISGVQALIRAEAPKAAFIWYEHSPCQNLVQPIKQEIIICLKHMENNKARGPDDIPIESLKALGDDGINFFTNPYNKILGNEEVPLKWGQSYLVPIFKNKGYPHNCQNYRGIKLMSHSLKLYEKILEKRLRDIIEIGETQFGFIPGRSTTDAIHAIRICIWAIQQWSVAQQVHQQASQYPKEFIKGRFSAHFSSLQ